jgi:hypothetical protein
MQRRVLPAHLASVNKKDAYEKCCARPYGSIHYDSTYHERLAAKEAEPPGNVTAFREAIQRKNDASGLLIPYI